MDTHESEISRGRAASCADAAAGPCMFDLIGENLILSVPVTVKPNFAPLLSFQMFTH